MSEYLTLAQARETLGVSPFLFNKNFRPQLTEFPRGDRTILFDRIEVEQLRGESDPMWKKKTVGDALDHAWRLRWSKAKGSKKKEALKNKVDEERGSTVLSKVDYAWSEQYVFELQERDLSPYTIRSRLSCLKVAFDMAQKRGWLKAIPPFPTVESGYRKLRWANDAEIKKLRVACDQTIRYEVAAVMQDVMTALLDTGARVGELVKVREDSITIRGRKTYVAFLDRKGGDNLSIPLTTAAEEALYRLLASDYWMRRVRGARESAKRRESAQNWVTHQFTEIRDRAGLPDVSAHTFRHTFASRLVQRGVDIYKVQKLLGHSDIRMTERYSHLAPSSLDDAIDLLEPADDRVTKLDDYRNPK